MKKILFDLDNTIIQFLDEYDEAIDRTFSYFHISCDGELRKQFHEAYKEYENNTTIFTKSEMREYISKYLNMDLPNNFIDIWLQELSTCAPEHEEEIISVFQYLASKYEIYIITNWYTDSQTKRLEKLGILPYIKEVIGCDHFPLKPNLDMYQYCMDDCGCEDVIVVGDNFEVDIKPAIELGIYAYHVTDEVKKTKDNLYEVIHHIRELKNLL